MTSKREADRAAEQHAADLSRFPNVVGVGVRTVRPDAIEREHVVAVYVSRKVPLDDLQIDERLPRSVQIVGPHGTVQVPVEVVESGPFELEGDTDKSEDSAGCDGEDLRPE